MRVFCLNSVMVKIASLSGVAQNLDILKPESEEDV